MKPGLYVGSICHSIWSILKSLAWFGSRETLSVTLFLVSVKNRFLLTSFIFWAGWTTVNKSPLFLFIFWVFRCFNSTGYNATYNRFYLSRKTLVCHRNVLIWAILCSRLCEFGLLWNFICVTKTNQPWHAHAMNTNTNISLHKTFVNLAQIFCSVWLTQTFPHNFTQTLMNEAHSGV